MYTRATIHTSTHIATEVPRRLRRRQRRHRAKRSAATRLGSIQLKPRAFPTAIIPGDNVSRARITCTPAELADAARARATIHCMYTYMYTACVGAPATLQRRKRVGDVRLDVAVVISPYSPYPRRDITPFFLSESLWRAARCCAMIMCEEEFTTRLIEFLFLHLRG